MRKAYESCFPWVAIGAMMTAVIPGHLHAQPSTSALGSNCPNGQPCTPAPSIRPAAPPATYAPPARMPTLTAPPVGNQGLQNLNQGLGAVLGIMNMMNAGTQQAPQQTQEFGRSQADPLEAQRKAQAEAERRARINNPFKSTATQAPPAGNPFQAAAAQALSAPNPLSLTSAQKQALADGVKGCEALEQVAAENRALASGPGGEYQRQAAIVATKGAARCWEAVGGNLGGVPRPGAATVATLGNLSDQLYTLLSSSVLFGRNSWDDPSARKFRNALGNLFTRVNYADKIARRGSPANLAVAQSALPGLQDEFEAILSAAKQRQIDERAQEEALAKQVTEVCGPGASGSRCASMVDVANSARVGKCIDNWCYCPKAGGEWFATWCYGTSDPNRATKYIDAWGDGEIRNGEKGTNAIVRRDNPFPGAPPSN